MREIVLDTETTGLDPYSGHRIVEIGCVELDNHIRTGSHYHVYLNPERDMPEEAERVHGLSSEFLKDKPLFRSIAASFVEFLQDSPLVIHNASFDMKFINAELERVGMPAIPMSRTIDTVMMARKKFPGQPANLDALCRRFNVDATARTKHGALLDSELLADVYLELLGGRQVKMGLDANKQEVQTETVSSTKIDIEYRRFDASSDEKRLHEQMLEQIKDPIWKKLEA
ncbi:MAG: DNA polymerase III subunit epsilon [Rickettsiales bacterium]|nr:DNA polymerase III subunit epsilon [Rickettsiales bacterium]